MKNLIEIYKDTFRLSSEMTDSVTTEHDFNDIIEASEKSNSESNIYVLNYDTVSAGLQLSKIGKTCLLNMASNRRPGGGVENGALAQEECLFRCSNLCQNLKEDFYPLLFDRCLYTKDAVFFKDHKYDYITPTKFDVVTIPALNLSSNSVTSENDSYKLITKDKIRLMLSLAIKNDVKNIILGAWGCGVFKNNPDTISTFFHEILIDENYQNHFDNIVFAIINDSNSTSNNLSIFEKKFQKSEVC